MYGSTESVSGKFLRPSDTAPRLFQGVGVLQSGEEMGNKKRVEKSWEGRKGEVKVVVMVVVVDSPSDSGRHRLGCARLWAVVV